MGVKGEPGAGSPTPDREAKPASTKHQITIKISANEDDIQLKAKGSTKFSKIYEAVANNRGIEPNSFTLTHDGRRIQPSDTPESLEFEEEEQIDFHIQQTGGGLARR
ncbi:hypothetical protein JCM10213_007991 [Rhodosporidiobolus nylandii]